MFNFFTMKKEVMIITVMQYKKMLRSCSLLVLIFLIGAFSLSATENSGLTPDDGYLLQEGHTVTGTVVDKTGLSIPGVNVYSKTDKMNGVITDLKGKYTLTVPDGNAVLVFSFIGFDTQEVPVNGRSKVNVTLLEETKKIDEVVVVGYGVQKKVNVTGAVSVVDGEAIEDRPVSNMQAALQGMAPNLNITASNGQPGSGMNMNIRGLSSFEGDNAPYVLVDNIPMSINDVDPDDVASISVLKDAAASAIYGARAAYGVILITTKSGSMMKGKVRVGYTGNFSISQPTLFPEYADPMSFALTMNDAALNANQNVFYDEETLDRLAQNIANPGSAVTMYAMPDMLTWDHQYGLGAAGVSDWREIYWKDWSFRQKHNFNVTGGSEKVNYFFAAGYYDEKGLMRYGNESYQRFNLDGKMEAKVNKWLKINFIVKYVESKQDYPWDFEGGTGRIMEMVAKLKPTLPMYYPNPEDYPNHLLETTDVLTKGNSIGKLSKMREDKRNQTLVFSPRIVIEPVKDWFINIDFNYKLGNNRSEYAGRQWFWLRPNNTLEGVPSSRESTVYDANMYSNKYMSPNIYSSYFKQWDNHYFKVLVGYQQELRTEFNLYGDSQYLITDEVPSISTAVGFKTVDDGQSHWSTQSLFARFNYNYKEKYLLEVNFRADGSSKFEPGHRWGGFPSFSTGYIISNEKFWPLKNIIEYLKLRYSYGSLGNQNVANYLYIPRLGVGMGSFLFEGERLWTVTPPSLTSINLTWEKVNTSDAGFDMRFLNNRLTLGFDWYQSLTNNLVGPGEPLPSVLGTSVPKQNNGEIRIRGWEVELGWQHTVKSFSYGARVVLSDYNRIVTKYNNPNNLLSTNYVGKTLGEIWGFKDGGYFKTQEEADNYPVDMTYIWGGAWYPGDFKWQDLDGDGKISVGENTLEDHGDKVILGNSTPRYSITFAGNLGWKGFDVSFMFQGVGKRDVDVRNSTAKGPAIGLFHATVYKEHLDYWRDDSSPLGPNLNAYYPRPYSEDGGQNNKNWANASPHFMQSAAYLRLKNFQIGYSLPRKWMEKAKMEKVRIFFTGENVFTLTSLKLFDPETIAGNIYPLSKILSFGLNVNF
jgi:TonB-linked SusC/RagA family outer membrane protein